MTSIVKAGTARVVSTQVLNATAARARQRLSARVVGKQVIHLRVQQIDDILVSKLAVKLAARLPKTPFGISATDTDPPTIPQNLIVTAHTAASVSLAWDASSDFGTGVKEYSIRRGGVLLATVTAPATTFTDTGLTASTTYTYTVRARDFALNVSADSNTASGTTDSGGDTTPPTQPTDLRIDAHTTSSVSMSWAESTDNVAVTGYIVTRDGAQVGPTAGTTYLIGPTQPVGRRTIADANALALVPGDTVLFDDSVTWTSYIDPPVSGSAAKPITYGKFGGTRVRVLFHGSAAYITGRSYLRFKDIESDMNGVNDACIAINPAGASCTNISLIRAHLHNTGTAMAINQTHGVVPGGPKDDADWYLEDCIIEDCGDSGIINYGSRMTLFATATDAMVIRRTGTNLTGPGRHGIYADGPGLRIGMNGSKRVRFELSGPNGSAVSFRQHDQLIGNVLFKQCSVPFSYFPYDPTGIAGVIGIYDCVIDGEDPVSGPGPFLSYYDSVVEPTTGLKPQVDVEIANLTVINRTSPGLAYTNAVNDGRHVTLRNIAFCSTLSYKIQTGITATGNISSDYNSFEGGGKPSYEGTHSLTPADNKVNATTYLPNATSPLTAAGTTTVSARYTPASTDIGFLGSFGTQASSPSRETYTDTGLTSGTTYAYTIIAVDAAGNQSTPSASVNGTTDAVSSGFTIGMPKNWGKLTSAGGHRPSLTVFDANAKFGPQTSTYYDNATVRAQPRGTLINSDTGKYYYWPRALGFSATAITAGVNFKITCAGLVAQGVVVGEAIYLNDFVGKAGSPLSPKPDGLYTVKSVSGNDITFNESWTGTGVYNNNSPGYAIKDSLKRHENYYQVVLTQAQIEAHAVCPQTGTVFFTQDSDGYWRWTGGYTNRWIITGTSPGSLKIRVVGNLDVINASAEYATNGLDCSIGLVHPYSTLQWANCSCDINGMSAQCMTGGTMAYSTPLNGISYVQGEAISYQDVQNSFFQGVLNVGYGYDAEKMGGAMVNVRWANCAHYRNGPAADAGGGHTDCYQVFALDNSVLNPATDYTWQWVSMQSGGNSMVFLNGAAGGGGNIIKNCVAKNCIAWRGNKFADLCQAQNIGMRHCWVNNDRTGQANTTVRPDALDFGDGDNHPFPTGSVIWPDASGDFNMLVDENGATSVAPRVFDGTTGTLPLVSKLGVSSTFAYSN